jgi:hypothetical protein
MHGDEGLPHNCSPYFVCLLECMPLLEALEAIIAVDNVLEPLEDETIRCPPAALIQAAVPCCISRGVHLADARTHRSSRACESSGVHRQERKPRESRRPDHPSQHGT